MVIFETILEVFFELHKFPFNKDVLYIGPSDSHGIGYFTRTTLGEILEGNVYPVHVDAGWVKEKMKEGDFKEFQKYMQYIFENARKIFYKEKPEILFTTPKIIEMLLELPIIKQEDLQEQIKEIIYGGMEMKTDAYQLLCEEIFPNTPVIGAYGNTLYGQLYRFHQKTQLQH